MPGRNLIRFLPAIIFIAFVPLSFLFKLPETSKADVLSTGLVAEFLFNDLPDSLSTIDRLGRPASALSLNGENQFIEYSDKIELQEDFSISLWLELTKTDVQQTILLKGEGCPDGNPRFAGMSIHIAIKENNHLIMSVYAPPGGPGDEFFALESKEPLPSTGWHFLAVTYSHADREFRLYVDDRRAGIWLVTKSGRENFSGVYETSASLKIGAAENYCGFIHGYDSFFDGSLDDIRVFSKVLTHPEVNALSDFEIPFSVKYRTTIWGLLLILLFTLGSIPQFLKKVKAVFRNQLAIALIGACSLSVLYYCTFLSQSDFHNTALFGGDSWEYQSMAVNLIEGHGFQRFGRMEKFPVYNFDRTRPELVERFAQGAGTFNAYRTPLYPVFLAAIYKIDGVNPATAKEVQFFLFALIAGFLPVIGFYCWGTKGLVSGLVAGPIFMSECHDKAAVIMTEPLFAFTLLLVVLAAIYFHRRRTLLTAAVLGVALGLAILTKGSIIFVPMIFFGHLLVRYIKTKERTNLHQGLVILATFFLTLAPWSIFASVETGAFVAISSEGETILLDSNNEKSTDGNWHPEWRNNKDFFYAKDQLDQKSSTVRVLNFYLTHYAMIPKMLFNKTVRGFGTFNYLYVSMIGALVLFCRKFTRNKLSVTGYRIYLLVGIILMIATAFEFGTDHPAAPWIKTGILILFLLLYFTKWAYEKIPVIFFILFVNFLLITLILYGAPRLIEVIDFLFILSGIYCMVRVASLIFSSINEGLQVPQLSRKAI